MPEVLREGPYRFLFYANEGNEPPHVHVRRDRQIAKFWLDPLRLARNGGLPQHEINRIRVIAYPCDCGRQPSVVSGAVE